MKKYLLILITTLIFIFPLTVQKASYLSDGDLGLLMDKLVNFTVCNIPLVESVPGMADNCSKTDPEPFDIVPALLGRALIRENLGCQNFAYDITAKDKEGDLASDYFVNDDKNVFLIGDSLTMFGGPDDIWDIYLGAGAYNVKNMGAAGATSSAWKDHFETCLTGNDPWIGLGQQPPKNGYARNDEGEATGELRGYGRPQMPPRSIMMIGGNDFHVYKGMLQSMWWAVPLRRLNVAHNIEKLITYHHQGNNGCGDVRRIMKDGKPEKLEKMINNGDGTCSVEGSNVRKDASNHENWGLGRLFVLLGNLPAVSIDPTIAPLHDAMIRRLGLYDKPNDDIASNDNIKQTELYGDSLTAAYFASFFESRILYLYALILVENYLVQYGSCGNRVPFENCKDHTWISRQMYKLQFTSGAMALIRGGVPYVHMYSLFRDNPANDRGCWWCADRGLWMGPKENYNHVLWSGNDGIHINHPNGYLRWGSILTPIMGELKMDEENRLNDGISSPGGEINIPQGCDDLCLYILCVMFSYCKP